MEFGDEGMGEGKEREGNFGTLEGFLRQLTLNFSERIAVRYRSPSLVKCQGPLGSRLDLT